MSDPLRDGSTWALSLIAFIGSVFSPYYAWQRRRWGDDQALAEDHVAVNVSLYHRAPGARGFGKWWTMTERGHHALARDRDALRIGPSRLAWMEDGALQVLLDERTAPWPRPVRGRLTLRPRAQPARAFRLQQGGLHHWQPIAPSARIEVDLQAPATRWEGEAYMDSNWGRRPLARDFARWHWARRCDPGAGCRVVYALEPLAGEASALDLQIDGRGSVTAHTAPPRCDLPTSGWGLHRQTCADPRHRPVLSATLESGPFYCRSLLDDAQGGAPWMHETLDLRRFRHPLVQAMLPFRMPRRSRHAG
ncbi:carotenoid 1,2-hydratase [uncultured Pseudacidovorax sp.]|uniref:carotenoid 1,2-hydratase n=1 Tax=uncultured Pseudacidovorax sp. TaxID=679313 RepID=UPI0025D5980B|nr:carotenoid 1,2-hydratase [uncultured Pseudacidovorax sp.]